MTPSSLTKHSETEGADSASSVDHLRQDRSWLLRFVALTPLTACCHGAARSPVVSVLLALPSMLSVRSRSWEHVIKEAVSFSRRRRTWKIWGWNMSGVGWAVIALRRAHPAATLPCYLLQKGAVSPRRRDGASRLSFTDHFWEKMRIGTWVSEVWLTVK